MALSDSGNLALLGTALLKQPVTLFSLSPLSVLPSFLRPSVPHPFCLFPPCLIFNYLFPSCHLLVQSTFSRYIRPSNHRLRTQQPSILTLIYSHCRFTPTFFLASSRFIFQIIPPPIRPPVCPSMHSTFNTFAQYIRNTRKKYICIPCP